jgi:alkaline phosphatase
MEQQVYQGIDVVFGGGKKQILTTTNGGARTDNENLIDSLTNMGYIIVNNKTELSALPDTVEKVWGHFAMDAMARDLARKNISTFNSQPSLAQMTDKALRLLSNSVKGKDKGFFLMIEASQVDWASHANDPVGVIGEYLAFDSAVTVAYNFAKSNANTLLLVFSDHDNGGLSLGSSKTDPNYSSRPIDSLLTPSLSNAILDGASIEAYLGPNRSNTMAISNAVSQYYGISDLTNDELTAIAASAPGSMEYTLGPIMSKRTDIGWTTTGHTGNDVPLYYYGTNDHFGLLENTDIAWICAKAMNLDLNSANNTLFQNASTLFNGMILTIDTTGVNNGKGSLTVSGNGKTAILPFNKNEIFVDGNKYRMNGLTVYSIKKNAVFVPQQALDLFNGGTVEAIAPAPIGKIGVQKEIKVELFDMHGRKIFTTTENEYRHAIARKKVANGNYIIRINNKII